VLEELRSARSPSRTRKMTLYFATPIPRRARDGHPGIEGSHPRCIDHGVLEWFKAKGRGYQILRNNVLRSLVGPRQSVGPPMARKKSQ